MKAAANTAPSEVVYITFQAPAYLKVRKNPAVFLICQTCAKGFTCPGRTSQKKAGKVYPRRFCSRLCYQQAKGQKALPHPKEEFAREP